MSAASPAPEGGHGLTDAQIIAAWDAWPKTSITSRAGAVEFVRAALVSQAPAVGADDARDAARWRWIRQGGEYIVRCPKATFHCGGHTMQPGSGANYAQAFDAAIDEAMGKVQPPLTGGTAMKTFAIDTQHPPDLGPIERDRYVFCCENGCGECQAVLVTFRDSLHTSDGQVVSERTHPEIVSSCCGAAMFVWDQKLDTEADPAYRTVSIELPTPKSQLAPDPSPAGRT